MMSKKWAIVIGTLSLASTLVFSTLATSIAAQTKTLNIKPDMPSYRAVDTASSATPKKPSQAAKPVKPSSVPKKGITQDAAVQLAADQLQANDAWSLVYAKLNADENVYWIVWNDPAGDAHLRLVDAITGKITNQNIWEYFFKNEEESDDSDRNDTEQYQEDRDDEDEENEARINNPFANLRG